MRRARTYRAILHHQIHYNKRFWTFLGPSIDSLESSRCFHPFLHHSPPLPASGIRGGRTCPSGFPVWRWKASWTYLSVPFDFNFYSSSFRLSFTECSVFLVAAFFSCFLCIHCQNKLIFFRTVSSTVLLLYWSSSLPAVKEERPRPALLHLSINQPWGGA